MAKKERCFCGSGKASKNCHRVLSGSKAALLFELYNRTEQAIDTYYKDNDKNPLCYAGCNNCCSDFFAVSEVELEIIMDEIHNSWTQPEIIKLYKKVMRNMKTFETEHLELLEAINTQMDYESQLYKYKLLKGKSRTSFPCPLLDVENGRCSMYQVRPFICRTHGTTHYFLSETLREVDSTVCEYIPSRLKNNEHTPNISEVSSQYYEIVNVSGGDQSLVIRKLPIFYGIFLMVSMQKFNPTKPLVINRQNLDMTLQESNKRQIKVAYGLR